MAKQPRQHPAPYWTCITKKGSGYIGGLLLPKVELTSLTQMISAGHEAELTGLVVYNTSSSEEGVYVCTWDSSTGKGEWKANCTIIALIKN